MEVHQTEEEREIYNRERPDEPRYPYKLFTIVINMVMLLGLFSMRKIFFSGTPSAPMSNVVFYFLFKILAFRMFENPKPFDVVIFITVFVFKCNIT